jgi:hypothetical protein
MYERAQKAVAAPSAASAASTEAAEPVVETTGAAAGETWAAMAE